MMQLVAEEKTKEGLLRGEDIHMELVGTILEALQQADERELKLVVQFTKQLIK